MASFRQFCLHMGPVSVAWHANGAGRGGRPLPLGQAWSSSMCAARFCQNVMYEPCSSLGGGLAGRGPTSAAFGQHVDRPPQLEAAATCGPSRARSSGAGACTQGCWKGYSCRDRELARSTALCAQAGAGGEGFEAHTSRGSRRRRRQRSGWRHDHNQPAAAPLLSNVLRSVTHPAGAAWSLPQVGKGEVRRGGRTAPPGLGRANWLVEGLGPRWEHVALAAASEPARPAPRSLPQSIPHANTRPGASRLVQALRARSLELGRTPAEQTHRDAPRAAPGARGCCSPPIGGQAWLQGLAGLWPRPLDGAPRGSAGNAAGGGGRPPARSAVPLREPWPAPLRPLT